ncbi:MAG: GNAT family N-acetyltransferase [Ktedonobacteraceae bacterium]|nr:GNAT family N-acetyltransferase [Ktedonobacteraceae bacterium]
MKYIPLAMVRDHMEHIPFFPCPDGYRIRTFVEGDERHWARIEMAAGEFSDQERALQRFAEHFGADPRGQRDRCFLLENQHGEAIGTASAWYGNFEEEERGRISWVGIVPAFQGKKLAKPLLSVVMARLARDHQKVYLTTQTTSYQAINLYLNFGFVPYPVRESCEEGWRLMEQVLQRKIL